MKMSNWNIMWGNKLLNLLIILFITLMFTFSSNAQKSSVCERASMIVKTAQKFHYDPIPIDDKFSELVFTNFIQLLDPDGLYFTEEEIEQLDSYRNTIDEEILEQKCHLFNKVLGLYKDKLLIISSLMNQFSKKELSFISVDTIYFNNPTVYAKKDEFEKKWEKTIKFRVLRAYFSNSDSVNTKNTEILENLQRIKSKVIKSETCQIKSWIDFPGGTSEYVGSLFLKAVALAFDPHTIYFTPDEENSFEVLLSKETFSYGFEIIRNNLGEIEITKILPGSSAWNSNKINEGDIILEIRSDESTVKSLDCSAAEELLKLMTSGKTGQAYFKIRKKSGQETDIVLRKEKIDVEDNVIKSFVLDGEQKIGYIYLPSFYFGDKYAGFSSDGCANDVAKELIRLKREGISGLIFDLRNNGGGSMLEAIQMAGIFIDYGAVCVTHTGDNQPLTLKDMNRGAVFSGNLVVLINSFSASASEIFAAAMQDYNRGLIVGSKSFGKSTGQLIVPLDAYKSNPKNQMKDCADGYLNITQTKLFRVTGESHQKTGVLPDIALPFVFDNLGIDENAYPNPLESSIIDKKIYYHPLSEFPIVELNALSKRRIESDSAFIRVNSLNKRLVDMKSQYKVPLGIDSFKRYYKSVKTLENVESLENKETFTLMNPSYLKGISSFNSSEKEIYENQMKQISKDIYVIESYSILNDLYHLNKIKNQ